jgi:hypothetical protein
MQEGEIVPFDELQRWYKARELFTGDHHDGAHREEGIALAATCPNVDDARWLCSMFPLEQIDVWVLWDAVKIRNSLLCRLGDYPARTWCFASMFFAAFGEAWPLLFKAAVAGYPWAQSVVWRTPYGGQLRDDDLDRYTRNAANYLEPNALFRMSMGVSGRHYNGDETIPYLKLAAELGHTEAMFHYATRAFYDYDPEAYVWLDKSVTTGVRVDTAVKYMSDCVKFLHRGYLEYASAVFTIGRVVKAAGIKFDASLHAYVYHGRGFFSPKFDPKRLHSAVAFFERESEFTRDAVNAWLVIACRQRVVKDIRRVIGLLIWESRGKNAPLERRKRRCGQKKKIKTLE